MNCEASTQPFRWAVCALASLVGLAGCGGADMPSELTATTDFVSRDGDRSGEVSTLTFAGDWTETVSGDLEAGGRFRIAYDEARLPRCRASHNGNPGWQITAFVRFQPSGHTEQAGVFDYQMTEAGPDYHTWIKVIPEFEVPADATGIDVWFYNRSAFDNPCEAWDSDYGRNYRFAVGAPREFASMLFQSNWQNILSGQVARGGALQVQYAPERMRSIVDRAISNGYFAQRYHCYGYGCCSFAYDTGAYVRFRSGAPFERAAIGDLGATFQIPGDAERVELYFDTEVTTTTWYCGGSDDGERYEQPTRDRFYDSNFGRNFQYTIP